MARPKKMTEKKAKKIGKQEHKKITKAIKKGRAKRAARVKQATAQLRKANITVHEDAE